MPLTISLGGVTLPLPESYDPKYELIAAQERMANGALAVDFVAEKAMITVVWTGLSLLQRNSLRNLIVTWRLATKQLILPDGRYYDVALAGAIWTEPMPFYEVNLADPANPTPFYDVTVTFPEA